MLAGNVLRLGAVRAYEASPVYTYKRLFKDTKLSITSNARIEPSLCYHPVGAHPDQATGYVSAYIFFVCVIAGEESSSPNAFLIRPPF
jgi:hypothetical protein